MSGEQEIELVNRFRKNVDPIYLKWAISQIVHWKNDWTPESVFHIHGTRDKIFPISKLKVTHSVSGAGHFMVYNRAEEVSRILNEILWLITPSKPDYFFERT